MSELGKKLSGKERNLIVGNMKRCILFVLCVSIMIFSGMGVVHAQLATLNPAANVTDTSAQLSGFVDPNGHDTHWAIYVWPGVTYNVYPPICGQGSLSGSAGNTPVSCTAQGLTPSTTYTFSLNADWPGTTMTAGESPTQGMSGWLEFTTLPAAPPFDFTMMVSPGSVSVVEGGTAHYAVQVQYSDPSYAGTLINVQLTGFGPGMDYQLSQSGDLTITTAPTTPIGSYSIVLTGSANGVTHQTGLTLIVTSAQAATTAVTSITAPSTTTSSVAFDYSVTVSPSTQSVEIGGSTSYVVSVLPLAGSPVPVSLTVMGCPGDVHSSFTTQSATPPYTSTLNLDLSTSSANAGAYTLTVVGTAGGNVKTATATLVIQPKAAQTTTSQTATSGSGWSDVLQQNSLIITAALLALAVVLGVLALRGRRQHAVPQPTGSQIFCSKCGTGNPAFNEFCRSCGSKLKTG